jgi:hypothetical protein
MLFQHYAIDHILSQHVLHDNNNDTDWGVSAWMMLHCLANAPAYHQNVDDVSPGKRQQAHDDAMRQFAITVREHITAAEVQTAAQQSEVWPF